jgi:hypothetical protein
MMTYLAKPYDKNFLDAVQFETMNECKKFLDEFTEQKMPLDEWCMLGKILEANGDGTFSKIYVDEETFL